MTLQLFIALWIVFTRQIQHRIAQCKIHQQLLKSLPWIRVESPTNEKEEKLTILYWAKTYMHNEPTIFDPYSFDMYFFLSSNIVNSFDFQSEQIQCANVRSVQMNPFLLNFCHLSFLPHILSKNIFKNRRYLFRNKYVWKDCTQNMNRSFIYYYRIKNPITRLGGEVRVM